MDVKGQMKVNELKRLEQLALKEEDFARRITSEENLQVGIIGEDWEIRLSDRRGSLVRRMIADDHRKIAEGYRRKANELRI